MASIKDLLTEVDAGMILTLIKYSKPSNRVLGRDIPDITQWRFCDVMDISGADILQAGIRSLSMHTGRKEESILSSDAVGFVSYLSWLRSECEKVDKLMEHLNKEPDMDLASSGIDKMDKYGVVAIYYAISKDPTDWDRISEVPFHVMYTKLMMDKDTSEIQESYNRVIMERQTRKR